MEKCYVYPSQMTIADSPPPSSLKGGTQEPTSLQTPRQERTSEPQLHSELEVEHNRYRVHDYINSGRRQRFIFD